MNKATSLDLGPSVSVPGLLLVAFGLEGDVIQASDAWLSLMGYTADVVSTLRLLDLIHPDDLVATVRAHQTARDTGIAGSWVSRYRTVDGSYRKFRMTASFHVGHQTVIVHATDITPESRPDDMERLLPLVAESNPAFLYLYDLDQKQVLYLNRRVTASLGYSEKDIAGFEVAFDERLLHPEDRQMMEDIASRVQNAEDGQAVEMEYRYRHSDGSYRWFWNRCVVYARKDDGRPVQVVGSLYDVTERREREDSYRLLFKSSPHPMWVFDMETLQFLAVNEAAENLYGYSREEFLNLKADEIRPEEDRKAFYSSIAEGAHPEGENWRHVNKQGEILEVRVWARELNYMGREARLVTVVDETAKREALNQLTETMETMEAVLNQSPVAIFALDKDGRVRTWNPAASAIFSLTESVAVGTELRKLVAQRSAAMVLVQETVQRGEAIENLTVRARRRDRTGIELTVSARPLRYEDGRVVGAVAVVADVTAKNQAERNLKSLNRSLERRVSERTAELEAANQELEAFCFSIAHDLRQPLRAIDGFSRAVIEDFGDVIGENGGMMLQRVRLATQRLGNTMDALLALSRVTRAQLDRDWVDLAEFARQTIEDLQVQHPERNVEVYIEPSIRAYGDPTLLRLLVENLLENAWKFTSKRSDAKIEFTIERMDGEWIYTIRDNGAGLDMRYANKLFQPFERLHTQEEFPGNGIGLATCQRVVTRHGGQIALVGAISKGATALFTLAPGP